MGTAETSAGLMQAATIARVVESFIVMYSRVLKDTNGGFAKGGRVDRVTSSLYICQPWRKAP